MDLVIIDQEYWTVVFHLGSTDALGWIEKKAYKHYDAVFNDQGELVWQMRGEAPDIVTIATTEEPITVCRTTAEQVPVLNMLLSRREELVLPFRCDDVRDALGLVLGRLMVEGDVKREVLDYMYQDAIPPTYIERVIDPARLTLMRGDALRLATHWSTYKGELHLQLLECVGTVLPLILQFLRNWRSVPIEKLWTLNIDSMNKMEYNALCQTDFCMDVMKQVCSASEELPPEKVAPYLEWMFNNKRWNKRKRESLKDLVFNDTDWYALCVMMPKHTRYFSETIRKRNNN